jgi:hypothetical protein
VEPRGARYCAVDDALIVAGVLSLAGGVLGGVEVAIARVVDAEGDEISLSLAAPS